jgi:hypothetical protein
MDVRGLRAVRPLLRPLGLRVMTTPELLVALAVLATWILALGHVAGAF